MTGSVGPSGTPRLLVAVEQAPRGAGDERIGDPMIVACISTDELIAKLDDMTMLARRRGRTGIDEGWTQAVREIRNWAKEAR